MFSVVSSLQLFLILPWIPGSLEEKGKICDNYKGNKIDHRSI
jgi:hypothetical protein